MSKPVIGIVPLVDAPRQSYWMLPGYMRGIEVAGGLGVMLPLLEDSDDILRCASLCDGILFTGGQDVSPAVYGADELPQCGETCPARDAMEAVLLDHAVENDIPFLGICRGIQFLNARMGGTLWQDLPTQRPSDLTHCQTPPYDRAIHEVELVEGSKLQSILGKTRIGVNSYHHQAVCEVAPRLEVAALATDGLVEALELPGASFGLAIQWHPEFSYQVNEDSQRIFEAFVQAAAEKRA